MFHYIKQGLEITIEGEKSFAVINVRVIPKSPRPRVDKMEDGTYRAYLKKAPEKGKANAELLAVMAEHLGVSRSEIVILRGHRSRDKVLKLEA